MYSISGLRATAWSRSFNVQQVQFSPAVISEIIPHHWSCENVSLADSLSSSLQRTKCQIIDYILLILSNQLFCEALFALNSFCEGQVRNFPLSFKLILFSWGFKFPPKSRLQNFGTQWVNPFGPKWHMELYLNWSFCLKWKILTELQNLHTEFLSIYMAPQHMTNSNYKN